ncbi:MAG: hypothetical protein KJP22_05315 [Acidimicrobiia bacterium]|nr:hypothetical protein [Acidimicrobiia bacterium]
MGVEPGRPDVVEVLTGGGVQQGLGAGEPVGRLGILDSAYDLGPHCSVLAATAIIGGVPSHDPRRDGAADGEAGAGPPGGDGLPYW